MEEGKSEVVVSNEDILVSSLTNSGIKIPPEISSIKQLIPPIFFSISSQFINIIKNTTQHNNNIANSPPLCYHNHNHDHDEIDYCKYYSNSSMSDKFKICSQLAQGVTNLGFVPPITFHNFLYPSEEDLYKLIRFFVKKLSELPEHVNKVPANKMIVPDLGDTSSTHQDNVSSNDGTDLKAEEGSKATLQDPKVNSVLPEYSNSRSQDSSNEAVSYSARREGFQKPKALKEVEQEIEAVLSETKKREKELFKLSADVENQPKGAPSRRSYIQRITEITKNSRKQDADIERILKDTRELQVESNYIQERLNRTYAVVDETVLREGKKDPVGQKAYRLLTRIHESFEQISDKILSTDRIRRETVEYEARLSALSRRSLNVEKLQADLDAIRRENEFLERHGCNNDDSGIL